MSSEPIVGIIEAQVEKYEKELDHLQKQHEGVVRAIDRTKAKLEASREALDSLLNTSKSRGLEMSNIQKT